jgi:hypothetical protein
MGEPVHAARAVAAGQDQSGGGGCEQIGLLAHLNPPVVLTDCLGEVAQWRMCPVTPVTGMRRILLAIVVALVIAFVMRETCPK